MMEDKIGMCEMCSDRGHTLDKKWCTVLGMNRKPVTLGGILKDSRIPEQTEDVAIPYTYAKCLVERTPYLICY